MEKKFARQMYLTFCQAVGERSFLQAAGLSRKAAAAFSKHPAWSEMFGRVAERFDPSLPSANVERLRVTDLLGECEPVLDRIAPRPDEGWLRFTYDFARQRMFPDAAFAERAAAHGAGSLFLLAALQVAFDVERQAADFDWQYDFDLLGEAELVGLDSAEEYGRLSHYLRREYIYETMRLGSEATPFQLLGHISGVHHVAMSAACDLVAAGVPVDLSLVSGAALVHDIGKFGCKPGESVPYLHYYYTDSWCRQRGIDTIGYIAANHSTWDLELDNLQVESLLLIYADFRVKQQRDAAGRELNVIYSLQDSFDVILSKLDNVDDTKRHRYEVVYSKLHDFEDYMVAMGVDVTLSGRRREPSVPIDIALMAPEEIISRFKFLGVEHNIAVMRRLSGERLFGNILEAARSEKKWKNIRAYINIFEEYFAYLSSRQKEQTLSFLYELLMHHEGDIRRQAAALMGKIIARFNEGYHKELPSDAVLNPNAPSSLTVWDEYLARIILPDHKLTAQHKSWIGFTLKFVVASALNSCASGEQTNYFSRLLEYLRCPGELDDTAAFVLLDSINELPLGFCTEADLELICDFAIAYTSAEEVRLRIAAMRVLRHTVDQINSRPEHMDIRRIEAFVTAYDPGDNAILTFLKGRLLGRMGLDNSEIFERLRNPELISDIFLDNLKMGTPWIVKSVSIKLIIDQVDRGNAENLLHIATHFSNLIKVSERVVVRHDAGKALLKIAPLLAMEQRNEIAVELAKGLEIGEYEISKYIPEYLGEFALWLESDQLDELINRLEELLSSSNDRVVSVTLSTIGVILSCYSDYADRFGESEAVFRARQERLLGMLLKGLASYREAVRQEALLVIGQGLFGSSRLTDSEKARMFALTLKKLLSLICEHRESDLTFFYRAAALKHIYSFIANQELFGGGFVFEKRSRVAFFPGTFDPFTLSHKGIAQAIRDLGFEVMLALDEFSWSKKTQPRLIRRQIINMSVADEFHVHMFPDDMSVNIANPDDLAKLEAAFPDRELYIAVGSDVVQNASAYKVEPQAHSIHHFNHIVFRRAVKEGEDVSLSSSARSQIDGDILELTLPVHLEDISSTRIRESVDNNRNISNLIDATAEEFIYQNGLYLREPQYKAVLQTSRIEFEYIAKPTREYLDFLIGGLSIVPEDREHFIMDIVDFDDGVLILRNGEQHGKPIAFASMRVISSAQLFPELQDIGLAEKVRQLAAGKILLITGLLVLDRNDIYDVEHLLLTEALTIALGDDCTYALFNAICDSVGVPSTLAALARQGFVSVDEKNRHGLLIVDMRSPVVLIQNMATTIKPPFAENERVLQVIRTAHQELQLAMTKFYPGSLVLSLSSALMNQRMIDIITAANGVSRQPTEPRQLGPCMCVPFGKILRDKVVPNTVTKTLHTDKVFEPDLRSNTVEAYLHYSPLASQIRTIKSFRRPVILVDDLLHAGDRLRVLDPIFKQEEIDVRLVVVGLLSSRGQDLMDIQGRALKGVYYIPNMKHWFVESTLYPFIGGDTVRRDSQPVPGLLPSVNLILPYFAPSFFEKGCSRQAVYDFSLTCLTNARKIMLALELEYRALYGRNLTLNRLSEAVILPLCPDKGSIIHYDPNIAASVYLENDIEMLMRTEGIIEL